VWAPKCPLRVSPGYGAPPPPPRRPVSPSGRGLKPHQTGAIVCFPPTRRFWAPPVQPRVPRWWETCCIGLFWFCSCPSGPDFPPARTLKGNRGYFGCPGRRGPDPRAPGRPLPSDATLSALRGLRPPAAWSSFGADAGCWVRWYCRPDPSYMKNLILGRVPVFPPEVQRSVPLRPGPTFPSLGKKIPPSRADPAVGRPVAENLRPPRPCLRVTQGTVASDSP